MNVDSQVSRSLKREQQELEKKGLHETESDQTKTPCIGMYYPTAGSFHTSGIAMYVQQLVDLQDDFYYPFLYTEAGSLTSKLQQSDTVIIQVNSRKLQTIGKFINNYIDVTNSIPFAILEEKLPLFIKAFQDGTLKHANENLDVLLTHHFFDNIILSNLLDIPVIHVFHGIESTGLGMKTWKKLSRSDHIIANSSQTKKAIETDLDREVAGIVHPGVDLEQFNPNVEPIDKNVFNRHEFVVLFAGRFVESKGIYDLIEAFEKLPSGYHLYIIGRGEKNKIKERISGSTIENSVTIEGSVDHELLPQYYAAADIVCSPTHYDSFCMVNIEAMACGTPVITTDIEGVAEYAINRETAMLVPPENPEELSNAVLELSTSPALQETLKEQGRAMAEQFSWENSARELMDIYNELTPSLA